MHNIKLVGLGGSESSSQQAASTFWEKFEMLEEKVDQNQRTLQNELNQRHVSAKLQKPQRDDELEARLSEGQRRLNQTLTEFSHLLGDLSTKVEEVKLVQELVVGNLTSTNKDCKELKEWLPDK